MMRRNFHSMMWIVPFALALMATQARGALLDFNTFTAESYPTGNASADAANWVVSDGGFVAGEINNSTATVFYSQQSILNTRIRGVLTAGTDDDYVGLALGFKPGDTTSPTADYLLIDWKRANQGAFNYTGNHHDLTPGGINAPLGMAINRVQGVPTNDELWQHANLPGNPNGGVTELARGATLGGTGYSALGVGASFEIVYEANRVQVFVNGVQQFDLAGTFADGRLAMYELSQSPGALFSQFSISGINEPSAETQRHTAGLISVPLGSTTDAASTWTMVATGEGAHHMNIVSFPNLGDVEIAFNGALPRASDGILLTTVAQNTASPTGFVTAQGAFNHTGYGQGNSGIATHGINASRGEANANVAAAFFPFAQGWVGGQILVASGTVDTIQFVNGNGVSAGDVTQLITPSTVDQNGLYNVVIPGVNSATDGLFFVNAATNEGNYASATRNGTGGWRVGVRDNFLAANTTPDNFEHDAFTFLYMPLDTPGLVGAHVTGFDGNGSAITDITVGNYTLTRQGTGEYLLTVDGESPSTGILLLTGSSLHILANGEVAPMNHYLSYEAFGFDQFLINLRQINGGSGADLADGQFYFAFVPFIAAASAVPEPGTAALALLGLAALARRRRQAA